MGPFEPPAIKVLAVLGHFRLLCSYAHGQKSSIYPKIHIFKDSFSTKLTISKSCFSQNSQFQSLVFHKLHIFKVSLLTKFTFFKHQILGNFWIKSWFLPKYGHAYVLLNSLFLITQNWSIYKVSQYSTNTHIHLKSGAKLA